MGRIWKIQQHRTRRPAARLHRRSESVPALRALTGQVTSDAQQVPLDDGTNTTSA
jgi:hypothetical protein